MDEIRGSDEDEYGMNWFARLSLKRRRSTERQRAPQLEAYYWNGANPVPHSVRDISATGAYIVTKERWHPGTVLTVTLQSTDEYLDARPPRLITVRSKVVRWGIDGVGFAFVFPARKVLPMGLTGKPFSRFQSRLLGVRD
jgi:hypothetical protein